MKKNSSSSEVHFNFNKGEHITSSDLNSADFNFDQSMLYEPRTKLNDLMHWWNDFRANVYKWKVKHPTTMYSIKRLIVSLIVMFIAFMILALLVHSATPDTLFDPPGIMNARLTEAQILALRYARMETFGYDKNMAIFMWKFLYNITPFIPKYISVDVTWGFDENNLPIIVDEVKQMVLINFGQTVRSTIAAEGTPVTEIFAKAIPYSVAFGIPMVITSYLIGVPLGIEAAKRKNKVSDQLITNSSLLFLAIPPLITVLGIFLFSVLVFKTSATFSSGSFWSKFWPYITLLLFTIPGIVINTRRYVIDEMTSDHTRFAISQGFSSNKVYYIYIFRIAGIRIIRTIPGALLATLFGTSILVETQWGIPGMSRVFSLASSGTYDPFVIMGFITMTTFFGIFSDLLADLIVVWMDPRVTLTSKK